MTRGPARTLCRQSGDWPVKHQSVYDLRRSSIYLLRLLFSFFRLAEDDGDGNGDGDGDGYGYGYGYGDGYGY